MNKENNKMITCICGFVEFSEKEWERLDENLKLNKRRTFDRISLRSSDLDINGQSSVIRGKYYKFLVCPNCSTLKKDPTK